MSAAGITASAGSGGLLDRVLAWRDGLLASPRFQRVASGLPFTSGIARRRARALFDLCAGFVYSQVLLACVRLHVFDALRHPAGTADVAARIGLPPEAAERLLRAAASLRLVERRGGGRWGLGPLGAAVDPGVAAMIAHHDMLYADLADPVALLRGAHEPTRLSRYWAYAGEGDTGALDPSRTDAYSALMSASQRMLAEDVVAAVPWRRFRALLDVGGGDGTFLRAAHEAAPALQLMLFDLPSVAERARAKFLAANVAATVTGGDFRAGPLPFGADLISFVRVLHDHDDETVAHLLRAARAALPQGGAVLIAEPMAGTQGAEPVGDAYFGFYLLAMGQGRARTPGQYAAFLQAAGFAPPRLLRTRRPIVARALLARVDEPRTVNRA
ncbi:MAG TPA: methyltransferase [Acidisphaera sp.]|nr:methyltransferase [Acidisphaera sp.]